MSENIRVAIRFRPYNKKEEKTDFHLVVNPKQNVIEISEANSREIQQFSFDHVFDSTTSQEKIFNTVAKNAVEWVCQGYNATIFAYGATSSGKSYTMFGDVKEKGIVPRTCDTIFQLINNSEDVVEANMKCSFLEIYKEHIRDLLSNTEESLRIRHNPSKGIYVQGLLEKYVYTAEDILNITRQGTQQRVTASTALNNSSSRSHAVLSLTLTQKVVDGSEIVSKLHLIDLAGSENVGRSEAQGVTLTEAQNINKSLSCLGNVIYALTEKGREHIPYRDSKLTYLLQDSLGGNAKTILIATVSPAPICYSETVNTLKFAKRAKEIQNIPKINKNESIAHLLQTIEGLKKQIAELEEKCKDSEAIPERNPEIISESNPHEFVLIQTKCTRLEKKIASMEEDNKKGLERNQEVKKLFRKQRDLAKKVAKDLYKERVKNYIMTNELDQLRLFYNSLQEAVNTPEILPLIVKRTKINKALIETLDTDNLEIDDIEIESPSDFL